MSLTKLTADVENIQALSDKPNEIEGLTADQLKEKFDKAGSDIKTYINDTLTTEVDTTVSGLLDFFYPVGTIYETTSTDLDTTTKMATHFGGTWEVYGDGRVLVAKSADTEFDTIGETGGAKTQALTVAEMPTHKHRNIRHMVAGDAPGYGVWERTVNNGTGGDAGYIASADTSEVGGNQAHNNLQPYIVVYRYRRIA